MSEFDWNLLSGADFSVAKAILGGLRKPDLIISPEGERPYLCRWNVIPRSKFANIYFHIQLSSDPERPLHDHPWDNQSVILSGGYEEIYNSTPATIWRQSTRSLRKGDVQWRPAIEAHRLLLPEFYPYTMTLFSTGPVVREWGFWCPDGWRAADEIFAAENRKAIMKG